MDAASEGYRQQGFHRERLASDRRFDAGRDPGWSVPDFDLPTVAGGRVRKADFLGRRPALLLFASLTDPVAASAAPALRRLHREFGDAVAFVTVYVREAHPGERIPQPATPEEKLRHARALRTRDALPWTVAVDDLEGTLHRALGSAAGAHLVDPTGRLAFRTAWSNDARALRAALTAMARGGAGAPGAAPGGLGPALRALAYADEVLRAAGARAVADARREAPVVFAAAELAWLWRALTPLGRAVALGALAGAGLALVGGARLGTRRLRAGRAPARRWRDALPRHVR